MRLAIFGATGRTGRLVVAQALDAQHTVAAIVRSPARLPITHHRLHTVCMSAPDSGGLRCILSGVDAVVSVLNGSVREGSPASTWVRAILHGLEGSEGRRLIVTSAAPIGVLGARSQVHYRVVGRLFRDSHQDLAAMEAVVCGSDVDWTIVRPPRLTNGPRTGKYRIAVGRNVSSGYSISRADLAQAVLGFVDDPAALRRPVGIAY